MAGTCNFCAATVFLWQQPALPMKTALLSVLTATLLGFALFTGGRHFDAANFTAVLFTTGLVAWTIDQYSRTPRQQSADQSLRFPTRAQVRSAKASAIRLAA